MKYKVLMLVLSSLLAVSFVNVVASEGLSGTETGNNDTQVAATLQQTANDNNDAVGLLNSASRMAGGLNPGQPLQGKVIEGNAVAPDGTTFDSLTR